MSHEVVSDIVFKKGEVYITSSDGSIDPPVFSTWECEALSQVLRESGKKAALALIGENIFVGNFELRKGSKLCDLFLSAMSELPSGEHGINSTNFYFQPVGEFLANAVMKLEKKRHPDLSGDVKQLLALRDDKEYLLDTAIKTHHSYLNYASIEVQKDRDLAMEMVKHCSGNVHFELPAQFLDDKELILTALEHNGCLYRQLDANNPLKADKDIILTAFEYRPDKFYSEQLPRLIPTDAFFESGPEGSSPPRLNSDFCVELLDKCPVLQIEQCPFLLEDRAVALKWCEVSRFLPHTLPHLPVQFASDPEFQAVLVSRFEGTKDFTVLQKRFAEKGISLEGYTSQKAPLAEQIQAASSRASSNSFSANENVKAFEPER